MNIYVSKDIEINSFEKAQNKVRELIKKGIKEAITVHFAEGEYYTEGLEFSECDSGTSECPVTYKAEGKAVVHGGVYLKAADFEELDSEEKERLQNDAKEKVVKTDLKKFGITREKVGEICAIGSHGTANKYDGAVLKPLWCELFVNDKRLEIARYPNEGFIYTEEPVREGQAKEPTGKIRLSQEEWDKLRNPLGDIRRIDKATAERVKGWKNIKDVWVFGYPKYGWADESSPVLDIDTEKRTLETKYVSMFGICEHAPYYFFNVFEELDSENEWYLDRENLILYLYKPQNFENAEICLSLSSKALINIKGSSFINFEGFTFASTRANCIDINGSDISFSDCEIKNIGGWAVKGKAENFIFKNSHIHHMGEGGILLEGGDRNVLRKSGNLITNNHIHHIAEIFRTYRPAVCALGVGSVVSNNCIHDSAHMAIGFGGNEHIFEYNEIYNVCTIADDSSSIYSGRDYTICGNKIRYNYFHDIGSVADTQHIGTFAMYCDDNLGGNEIFGNIMERCQSALLLHGGHDIIFKNNLIIDATERSRYSLMFHAYGYWETLVEGGLHNQVDEHWKTLKKVPYNSELWKNTYPHILEYLTWDPETEQRYPHYCIIENNFIVNHKGFSVNFSVFEEKYKNIFRNNVEIKDKAFLNIVNEKELKVDFARLQEILPDFEVIPYEKMGLLK